MHQYYRKAKEQDRELQTRIEMTYTIKPLEWEEDEWCLAKASTFWGTYEITNSVIYFEVHYCFDEYYDEGRLYADSLEEAKEMAWEDWKNRMEKCLNKQHDTTTSN